MIAVIEAKKQNIFTAVENQTTKSLERLTKRKNKIEEQIVVIESSLEKAEKLLTASNAEVVQVKISLEIIFEGVDQVEPTDGDPEGLLVRLTFVENQKLLNIVNTEEIGSFRWKFCRKQKLVSASLKAKASKKELLEVKHNLF